MCVCVFAKETVCLSFFLQFFKNGIVCRVTMMNRWKTSWAVSLDVTPTTRKNVAKERNSLSSLSEFHPHSHTHTHTFSKLCSKVKKGYGVLKNRSKDKKWKLTFPFGSGQQSVVKGHVCSRHLSTRKHIHTMCMLHLHVGSNRSLILTYFP